MIKHPTLLIKAVGSEIFLMKPKLSLLIDIIDIDFGGGVEFLLKVKIALNKSMHISSFPLIHSTFCFQIGSASSIW